MRDQGPRLGAPRWVTSLAVLVGGAIGFFLQERWNLDNEGAFVLTILTCSMAAFVVNLAWLLNERRKMQP
ncbi:MAG: hypothetical protein HC915_10520 [Anaerolineae bacterium]|nr:hypothetical protein [Anaerolineae bacterium]